MHWLERLGRVSKSEETGHITTYKNPTGFPPFAGDGQANHVMPLAEHLRSAFLKTVLILRLSDGMFLKVMPDRWDQF